jgi:hypothetical protein
MHLYCMPLGHALHAPSINGKMFWSRSKYYEILGELRPIYMYMYDTYIQWFLNLLQSQADELSDRLIWYKILEPLSLEKCLFMLNILFMNIHLYWLADDKSGLWYGGG